MKEIYTPAYGLIPLVAEVPIGAKYFRTAETACGCEAGCDLCDAHCSWYGKWFDIYDCENGELIAVEG